MTYNKYFTIYNAVDPPAPYANKEDFSIPKPKSFDIPYFGTDTFGGEEFELEEPSFDNNSQLEKDFQFEFQSLSQPKPSVQSKEVLKGPKQFEQAFAEACKINPDVANYKNFLVKIADKESKFDSHIQNKSGAPYYGYFQMGKEEIKTTTGLSVEEFRNNPVQQILGAVKLYQRNMKTLKAIGAYKLCKEKGYSDDAIMAGAWAGGPGGVKKFIMGKGDPSDSHWYKNGGGTSVGKRMKEFNT